MAAVRRSLRIGIAVGILVGVIIRVRRTLDLRRQATMSVASPDPWTPLAPRPVHLNDAADPADHLKDEADPAEIEAAPAPSAGPGAAGADSAPAAAPSGGTHPTWVGPVDGVCPATHPVKAKVGSGIFHLPGMLAYDRTKPDRCYRDEADAAADGFTKAKR